MRLNEKKKSRPEKTGNLGRRERMRQNKDTRLPSREKKSGLWTITEMENGKF